jgi:hypothetical protein
MKSVPNLVFIVPYRDRQQHYLFFSNHMKVVLADREPDTYKILYIHQTDTRQFNRGALKNIGFTAVKSMYPADYKNITLVFNDIDTMPFTSGFLKYDTKPGTIKHFYGFKFTLGGIVSINAGDFESINGFPNFWAWGYEDNMLNARALKSNLRIDRSQFYPILDKNILHLMDGNNRIVNRSEYEVYASKTNEGINTIIDLEYSVDDSNGFVNVTKFNTQREENESNRSTHDLRNGSVVFGPSIRKRMIFSSSK